MLNQRFWKLILGRDRCILACMLHESEQPNGREGKNTVTPHNICVWVVNVLILYLLLSPADLYYVGFILFQCLSFLTQAVNMLSVAFGFYQHPPLFSFLVLKTIPGKISLFQLGLGVSL